MKSKRDIEARLQEMGFSPKRSLGQNFLINQHVIGKIIDRTLQNSEGDHGPRQVIEVGPGPGSLTEALIGTGHSPTVIELDREFAAFWRSRGLKVYEADALHLDWNSVIGSGRAVLVSNLPYQISSRLVIDRSSGPAGVDRMILMFQKEVAERLLAKPRSKEYGFLTVMALSCWKIMKVADAGAKDFVPAPKVQSRVLEFHRIWQPPQGFMTFVKKAFENRRKLMLKNFPDKASKMIPWLVKQGLTEKIRAEELTVLQFQDLFKIWQEDGH